MCYKCDKAWAEFKADSKSILDEYLAKIKPIQNGYETREKAWDKDEYEAKVKPFWDEYKAKEKPFRAEYTAKIKAIHPEDD